MEIVNKRQEFIDIAKAIGLILVIASHSVAYKIMIPFALCFIAIFFVSSGFTQVREISIKNRFKKLVIPYFIFNFGYIVLAAIMHKLCTLKVVGILYGTYSLFTPPHSGNGLIFLDIYNGPTWFLLSLFVSSIWFSFLLKLQRKYILPCLLLYLSITIILHYGLNILLPWQINTSFFFAILMFFGKIIREKKLLEKKVIIYLSLVVYIIAYYFSGKNVNLSIALYGKSVVICLIGAVCGSLVLLEVSRIIALTPLKSIFLKLNEHGLTLFCIQMPIIAVWEIIGIQAEKALNIEHWSSFTFNLIELVLIIITCYFAAKLLNRISPRFFP